MKKNAVIFFFKSLLKSILVIGSILAVGVISYKISYDYLSKQAESGKLDVKEQELENILEQAQTDDVSKNLIYVVDDKDNIKQMMVEICNKDTCNMDYVTIPVNVDFTIPTVMYQKLCVVDEEIPQIVRLSRLRKYFSHLEDAEAYGYAELIVEKLLGIKVSYFTVLSLDIYKSHYQRVKQTTEYTKVFDESATPDPSVSPEASSSAKGQRLKASVTMMVSTLSDSHREQLKALNGDKYKIKEYIQEQYDQEGYFSNLTVYNKIGYVEVYQQVNPDNIHAWGCPGTKEDKSFVIDTPSASRFIKDLQNNMEKYSELPVDEPSAAPSDEPVKKPISSKGKKILILNGSQIAGLAAAKQKELTDAGFTVPKVGDYTEEVLTRTRIIVPKKRMGADLTGYFKNPEILVGKPQEGYKIEIILGTVDAN